eukprot:494075_1
MSCRFVCVFAGLTTGSYALHYRRRIYCQSNQTGSQPKIASSFGSKLVNGCIDIANKLSSSFKEGEIFHELKRKEVQLEIAMITLPLLFGGFTSYRLYLRRRKNEQQALAKWINKDFHDVINISLNTVVRSRFSRISTVNGVNVNPYIYHIHYRTLIEKDARSIINNDEGVAFLTSTIQKCVANNQEIIKIDGKHKNKEDVNAHWAICSAIMSQISNLSHTGYTYRDLLLCDKLRQCKQKEYYDMDLDDDELGVVSSDYVMALTCEGCQYSVSKTNKIRVILINKIILQTIIDDYKTHVCQDIDQITDDIWMTSLENQYNKDMFRDWNKKRWLLIKKIAQVYDKQLKINDKLDWANPLADLEIVMINQKLFEKVYCE